MRFIYTLLAILLSSTLWAQLPTKIDAQAAGFSKVRLERLSDFLNEEIESGRIPGGVCWIVRNGVTAHQQTYGYTNWVAKDAMTEDQIFFIQSMTKPIISAAFMMLYEEGHFELGDPLHKYLPQFQDMKVAIVDPDDPEKMTFEDAERSITLEHLLSHKAGFSHGLGSSPLETQYRTALYGSLGDSPNKTIEDRAMALSKLPLIGQPGEQWYYSAAPDVLALLIEQFSGMTVADFLQERIFDPLEMNDSGYNLTEEQVERVVGLHYSNRKDPVVYAPRQTPTSGNTVFGGTHGLFSTAEDYMKFCLMLLHDGEYGGKQLLSPATIELMTVNHTGEMREPGYGFGLGFGVKTDLAAADAIGSEGLYFWSGAYNTYFFIDPKEDLVAILMLQFAPYTDYYNRMFRQLVYQAIVD